MPRREEPVYKKNKERSPGSANRHPSENEQKRKSSAGVSRQPLSCRDAEESGKYRGGSSSSKAQSTSSRQARHSPVPKECARILNVPLPTGQAINTQEAVETKRPGQSAAYLDYHLNQQLRRRKKQIVDSLMAAILECLDKKLEALGEAQDGSQGGPSRVSPGRLGSRTQKSPIAGQKRQLNRDDRDDKGDQGDGSGGPDRNNKRPKIGFDDHRQTFACPYYKYDPERFKSHRTCCGPGWNEVHRVKEHLKRAHSLPKHQCNRCCQLFKEEKDLREHQRKAVSCPIRDPARIQRDLGDGYDQEQEQKLQKRIKKTSEDKWKEWYCILFKLPLDSADIPSPYHDIPSGTRTRSGAPSGDHFQTYCEYYRDKLTPLIHRHVEQEVEKAILDVEDRVKSNVREKIKGLPAMLHRLIQAIPRPEGASEGDFLDMAVPDGFEPDDLLKDLEFDEGDGFNFDEIPMESTFGCVEPTESSSSGSLSDSYCPVPSSNTSVDDGSQQQYCDPQLMSLPILDFNYPAATYLHPSLLSKD